MATKPGSVSPVAWPQFLLSRCVLLLTMASFYVVLFLCFFLCVCGLSVGFLVRLSVPVQVTD